MGIVSSNYISNFFLYFILYLGFSTILTAQNFNLEVEAIIQTNDQKNDLLEINGVAKNKTEANISISYELSVITSDASNNSSKNAQSGFAALKPFDIEDLSKTTVSVNPSQRTIVLLLIYNEDKEIIGTARKVFEAEKEMQNKPTASHKRKNEGISLAGLVTENTKTKFGKDFYDFFYQKFSMGGVKENEIVHIDEMISFGRTTKIMVKIDQTVVFQFFAKPNLDFLKQMAEQAVLNVNKHFERLSRQKEFITQY